MNSTTSKKPEKTLKLKDQTIALFDCIASLGYFIEVIDAEGYYAYISSNCNYEYTTVENLIGLHTTEVFDLTYDTSILLNTLKTGKPFRDIHCKYKSKKTNTTFNFLYDSFPIIEDNTIVGAITIYKYLDDVKRAINDIEASNSLDHINTEPISRKKKEELFTFNDIVCAGEAMTTAIRLSKKVAKSDSSILIVGETGTGKELFAQSIHSLYKSESQPFVAVNCAAIPEALLESILFGSTKGAYTDAVDKQGLFEEAQGGSIFLDELQALSTEMQAKLLRVLETKTVRRVGGDKVIPVDVRVISAMNTNPLTAINEGKLKADLFYRIAVITIKIPNLKERGMNDLRLLTNHFINEINTKLHSNIQQCSDETFNIFQHYDFPGNCRELHHIIEHAANMLDDNEATITPYHLPYYISESMTAQLQSNSSTSPAKAVTAPYEIGDYKIIHQKALNDFNDRFNTEFLTFVLKKFNGNISKAAREINISRQHLHGLIAKYNIQA